MRLKILARARAHTRGGFTIIEMLISMVIVLSVLGMSTRLFTQIEQTLSEQSGRVEAQQNGVMSLSGLDRDLRMAGVGVVGIQPILVQADARAITFNGDLISGVLGDPGSVYVDVDADSSSVLVYRHTDEKALPLSTVQYPDSTYTQPGGAPSNAETISYWFSRDSTSTAADEYIFFKRVNADPPSVVAKGIRISATDTVFQYFKKDTLGASIAIPSANLPLIHTAIVHGSAADTGKSLQTDSIRSVRVRFTTVYRDRKGVENTRRVDMTINIMNAGLVNTTTCGDIPIGVTPTGVKLTDGSGNPYIHVTWARSGDEGAGERDVERYTIYRRLLATPAFSDPVASIPAGAATYSYDDWDVLSGQSWVYGVSAQDCTPSSSAIGATGTIIIP